MACAPQLPTALLLLRSPIPQGQGSDEATGLTMLSWYLEFVATGLDESTLGAFNFQLGYLTCCVFALFLKTKNNPIQTQGRLAG